MNVIRAVRKLAAPIKPAVLVAGLGRCGTTMVCDAIVRSSRLYGDWPRFVIDIADFRFRRGRVYKTHDNPPPRLTNGVNVVFMFGNPMDAAVSAHKNFDGQHFYAFGEHYAHVHSPHASEHDKLFQKDVLLMEEIFDRWMRPQSFSFLSIRYENLFDVDVVKTLSDYVGSRVALPARRQRDTDWRSHPERDKLKITYRSLAGKVDAAAKAKVWAAVPLSRMIP